MSFVNIPERDLVRQSRARDFIDEKASVLVAPKGAKGISGIVFDVTNTEEIRLQTSITDHFTEDTTYINDNVVNQPIEVTLTGAVGEIFLKRKSLLDQLTGGALNRLSAIDAYAGAYTAGMTQKVNRAVTQADQAVQNINNQIRRVSNFAGLISGFSTDKFKRQREIFQMFYAFREIKQRLTVTLPWIYLENMLITNINTIQGNSETVSEFSITLKQLRFAQTQTTAFDENLFPPAVDVQSTPTDNNGINGGLPDDKGLLESIVDGISG